MSFALFLRGFVIVIVVFAITTYITTGSLWTTFIQTVICGVLIQIGYFMAVLLLVWRSGETMKREARKNETVQPKEESAVANAASLPRTGTPRSDHP